MSKRTRPTTAVVGALASPTFPDLDGPRQPRVGDVVQYNETRLRNIALELRAAIITGVYAGDAGQRCDLTTFTRDGLCVAVINRPYSATPVGGSWSWIP